MPYMAGPLLNNKGKWIRGLKRRVDERLLEGKWIKRLIAGFPLISMCILYKCYTV